MSPAEFIKRRQGLWAQRHHIGLGGHYRNSTEPDQGARGAKCYVHNLEDNLFMDLDAKAEDAFRHADGGELRGSSRNEGNLFALHSSSALACNVFHYWSLQPDKSPIAKACKLPSRDIRSIRFEAQLLINSSLRRKPNIDVVLEYGEGASPRAVGIECKLSEPYGRNHSGLKRVYLDLDGAWDGLQNCRRLACTLSPRDEKFHFLHAAQLLKHALALTRQYGLKGFRLLYLWYDVPGAEGVQHRDEINEFASIASQDGVLFQERTYQEVILFLAEHFRDRHRAYVDYLVERYV